MGAPVLALNAGSSSLKFALYDLGSGGALQETARGEASGLGGAARLLVRDPGGETLHDRSWSAGASRDEVAQQTLEWIGAEFSGGRPDVVGHRIVHGGPYFAAPTMLDEGVMSRLQSLSDWAPLHQPAALAIVRRVQDIWAGVPQIACFDTAFHAGQPAVARRFALPRELEAQGVRRYGFHGLSCQSVMARLAVLDPDLARERVLVAHLGAGASLSAVRGGGSVDTSMGFSPLDGLVMATRCGSLDPGVPLFLQRSRGMSADQVEDMLYHRSGLLGVSGISGDMRALLDSTEKAAREAVELFVFRAAREAGALASSMEGLDGIVFTGGIGENAPAIRADMCQRLGWLGATVDAAANTGRGDRLISAAEGGVRVWVLAADEERVIAEACATLQPY